MGPIHIIAIDFIEKLLPDDYGKNTLMSIIICTFSPFIEFFPAKDNSAKVAAQALLQHIGWYGMPYKITCDRGAAFVSRLIKEVTYMMGVELAHTMAYSKEENSIVERSNKKRNDIFGI
jgi:hypothetical protein